MVDEASEGLDSRGASALVELIAAARGRGAGVLFAEQQTQRMVGADRVISLRHGVPVVDAVTDADEISVTMRGPAVRLGELTDAADALGFRYMVERE